MFRVGVVGASGYTGAELLRLLASHPDLEVVVATAADHAGSPVAERFPSLAAAYPDLALEPLDPARLRGLDLVFLALPHGEAQRLVPEVRHEVAHVVDLSADFRLRDPAAYRAWYGFEHACPKLLGEFACGLPELDRAPLRGAKLVATPGCYVTAAVLALAPLVAAGVVAREGIVVDAASGVSGAGHRPAPTTHFGSANEDFRAYGLLTHRHTPEIEQALGATVLFTPHLAPMTRGILVTAYARARGETDPLEVLRAAYVGEPFLVVSERPPATKDTLGSNAAHLTARFDARTGWVVALAALDNLGKGAAGQAIQCANLALGLPETRGLPGAGVYP